MSTLVLKMVVGVSKCEKECAKVTGLWVCVFLKFLFNRMIQVLLT